MFLLDQYVFINQTFISFSSATRELEKEGNPPAFTIFLLLKNFDIVINIIIVSSTISRYRNDDIIIVNSKFHNSKIIFTGIIQFARSPYWDTCMPPKMVRCM